MSGNKVVISGGKKNKFQAAVYGGYYSGTSTAVKENIIEITCGDENIFVGVVEAYGSLSITGASANDFQAAVDTKQSGKAITISAGESKFKDNVTATAGAITLANATVSLYGAAQTITAGSLALNSGGKLNVDSAGTKTFTLTGAANIAGDINYKADNAILTFNQAVNINNGGKVVLGTSAGAPVTGAALTTTNSAVVTVESGGAIDAGLSTLAVTAAGGLDFETGSAVKLLTDGSVWGQINAGSSEVAFQDGAEVKLDVTGGAAVSEWEGETVIASSLSTNFDNYENVKSGVFKLAGSGTNLVVDEVISTANAVADSVPALTPNMSSAGSLMDRIMESGDSPVLSQEILDYIYQVQDLPAGAADVLVRQTIGEALGNTADGVVMTAIRTQGVVFNRLDRIRELGADPLTPPAAGNSDALNRFWIGGFGVWAKEKNTANVHGYDYSGGGVAIGYDRRLDGLPGLRLGVSAVFASGKLKNKALATDVDMDTFGRGVYGSYLFDNGFFIDANVAYAHTKNKYTTNMIIGGAKTGSFGINTWQLGMRAGAVLQSGSWQFIPSAGVRFIWLRQNAWADRLNQAAYDAGVLANWFGKNSEHLIDIPIQLKINTTIEAGSVSVTPELRLGYTIAAKKAHNDLTVGFVGSGDSTTIVGSRTQKNTFNAGFGLKIDTGGLLDVFVNYDFEAASKYQSHQASLGVGFEF